MANGTATAPIDVDEFMRQQGSKPLDVDEFMRKQGTSAPTAPAPPTTPAPQPTALQRLSQVTLGTQHPVDELTRQAKDVYTHPGEAAKSIGEIAGIPRQIWTDPSAHNIGQIGGTGIPGMVFGEHGLIKHPLQFGESVTGAVPAAEDVRNENWKALPGDIAGGVINLATMKKPLEAGGEAAGRIIRNAGESLRTTPEGPLGPGTKLVSRGAGGLVGNKVLPGYGAAIGAVYGPELAERMIPKAPPKPTMFGAYAEPIPPIRTSPFEGMTATSPGAPTATPIPTLEPPRVAAGPISSTGVPAGTPRPPIIAPEAPVAAPAPELGSAENPGWHSKIPTRMPQPKPTAAIPTIEGATYADVPKAPIAQMTPPAVAAAPVEAPAPAPAAVTPMEAPKAAPAAPSINEVVNKATGVKPLKANVPIREQLTNMTPPTETESPEAAAFKAKYPDKPARQMAMANGEPIVDAVGNNPETMKAIHDMTRVDLRQALINAGEDMGQKTVTNSKFAGEGGVSRQDAFGRLLQKGYTPEQIVKLGKGATEGNIGRIETAPNVSRETPIGKIETRGLELGKGEDLGEGLGTQHTISRGGERVGSVTVEPKEGGKVLHVHWLGGDLGANSRGPLMAELKKTYPDFEKVTYDRRRLAKGAEAATTEPREMTLK
jgi:hypothetical protein